jgi:opacity protein-like surface antigen
MKRFVCVVAVCLVGLLGLGASAQAQTAPAGPDSKMYADINFGPTLGHKSDAFVGGEFGYRFSLGWDVIVEVSHMGNVGTSDLDNRATVIANSLGGTASTAFKVTEFAAGVRYRFPVTGRWQPYVLGAVGAANVKTEVAFTVNGTVIDPSATVQLGSDLSGSLNKTILVLGFGVNVPFKTRYFGEIGYRYGSILAKTDNFETDKAIPTQRVILGVGVRF